MDVIAPPPLGDLPNFTPPVMPAAAPQNEAAAKVEAKPIRGEWQSVSGRDIAALLDPRPTLIVGSVGRRDEVGFATIIWATPISHDPAMVCFALRARSHTMSCIQKSRAFSLNVLPADADGVFLCEQAGTRTGFQFNKNVVVKHTIRKIEFEETKTVEIEVPCGEGEEGETVTEMAEKTIQRYEKVPTVDIATSWMLCLVDHIEEAGDHLLVVGYVKEAQTCAPRNESGLLIPQDALLCVQHGCFGKVELLDD